MREAPPSKEILFVVPGLGSFSPGLMHRLIEESALFQETDIATSKALLDTGIHRLDEFLLGTNRPNWMSKLQYEMASTYLWTLVITKAATRRFQQRHLLAGYSLGEIVCSTVYGAITEGDALTLILETGSIIETYTPKTVNYFCNTTIERLRQITGDRDDQEAFLAGTREHLGVCTEKTYKNAQAAATGKGLVMAEIGVEYGFHTSFVEPAKSRMLSEITFPNTEEATESWYSCAEGAMRSTLTASHFWKIIRGSIRLSEARNYLNKDADTTTIEIGPVSLFKNLSGLCQLAKETECIKVIEANDLGGKRSIEACLDKMAARVARSTHQGEEHT